MATKHGKRPHQLGVAVLLPSVLLASLTLAGAALAQVPEASELDVRAMLLVNGYEDIEGLAFEDGMWTATAEAPDTTRVTVNVHPASDRVYPSDANPTLDAEEVTTHIAALGYGDVHAPTFEDGVWKVEAENAAGQELLLFVDPDNGAVLGSRSD